MTSLTHRTPARAALALALASAASFAVVGGCVDTDSATNLYTVGPPMVEQVRLTDSTTDAQGIVHRSKVFGFGTQPQAQPTDEPANVVVAATQQQFRIIMDHLLLGNYLENISCTTAVEPDGSHFQFVPVGATPDDIAKCAVSPDLLPETCVGPNAVCICDIDAGCADGSDKFMKGQPVGVLDQNLDGAADLHQFRQNAVGFACGSDLSISVPIDLDLSYWNPSGDQQVPAVGGFDALGPAIVLTPTAAMPANVKCQLVFSHDVVDKAGLHVCVPENGDVKDMPCTPAAEPSPADTKAWTLQMEPLTLTLENPMAGGMINRTDPIILTASDTIPLAPASIQNIALSENGVPYTQITIALDMSGADITITSTAPGGFDPNATYTLTVPTTVTDTYGQSIVQPVTATFTTGA